MPFSESLERIKDWEDERTRQEEFENCWVVEVGETSLEWRDVSRKVNE